MRKGILPSKEEPRLSGQVQLTLLLITIRPRLHHLPSLYEALGPPCTQCGRRFLTDEDGKKKKTAHMDWHFRVHQRIIEAEKRGQHRSWYVDQADWVRSVEAIDLDQHQYTHTDSTADATSSGGPNAASGVDGASGGGPKIQYIPVPDDGDATNSVCPICQEKFETKWLDEAQEWVWTDALRVGGRAYHASCYAEVTKGGSGGGTPMYSRATPDPVLGKRKAEVSSFVYSPFPPPPPLFFGFSFSISIFHG